MKSIHYYWQTLNFVSISLAPVSLFFCLLVFFRRLLYRFNFIKSKTVNIPVIVVGNIYIGGNGKTPFVIWLVEQLKQAGYQPAVVSRGYGSMSEQCAGLTWPRQVNTQDDSRLFGDEPVLIHRSTHCPVFIDPNRQRAVDKIINDTTSDVIISDDGLQHYAMSRFIEINITDAKRLYGNRLCLPAGPLREPVTRLNSVDYIIYNISKVSPDYRIKEQAEHCFTMNYFTMSYDSLFLHSLSGSLSNTKMTLNDFKGKIVHAVAGIADPNSFFLLLKNFGLSIVEHAFSDHYQYKKGDLVFSDAYPVIMTEKDAIKCQSFSLSETWYLPIKAKIDHTLCTKIVQQLKTFNNL